MALAMDRDSPMAPQLWSRPPPQRRDTSLKLYATVATGPSGVSVTRMRPPETRFR